MDKNKRTTPILAWLLLATSQGDYVASTPAMAAAAANSLIKMPYVHCGKRPDVTRQEGQRISPRFRFVIPGSCYMCALFHSPPSLSLFGCAYIKWREELAHTTVRHTGGPLPDSPQCRRPFFMWPLASATIQFLSSDVSLILECIHSQCRIGPIRYSCCSSIQVSIQPSQKKKSDGQLATVNLAMPFTGPR